MNGVYQGSYSNNDELFVGDAGSDDFGLDAVEPLFFHPIADWQSYGAMEAYLKFDFEMPQDLFYFCHVSVPMRDATQIIKCC